MVLIFFPFLVLESQFLEAPNIPQQTNKKTKQDLEKKTKSKRGKLWLQSCGLGVGVWIILSLPREVHK